METELAASELRYTLGCSKDCSMLKSSGAWPCLDGTIEDTKHENRILDFVQLILMGDENIPWHIFWCILKGVPLLVI